MAKKKKKCPRHVWKNAKVYSNLGERTIQKCDNCGKMREKPDNGKVGYSFLSNVPWRKFEENSSTADALVDFAEGEINTYRDFIFQLWPEECKSIVRKMRASGLGIDFWRPRAKAACRRYGWI